MKRKLIFTIAALSIATTILTTTGFTETQPNSSSVELEESSNLSSNFNQFNSKVTLHEKYGSKDTDKKSLKIKITTEPFSESDKAVVSANGTLKIGNNNYKFEAVNQVLFKETLSNGESYIWGPLETTVKNKRGADDPLVMSIGYFPGSDELLTNITIGDLNSGAAVMRFGDIKLTEELALEIHNKVMSREN